MRRIKTITSYAEQSRYMSGWTEQPIGRVMRCVAEPYRFAPDHMVFRDDKGRAVFMAEVRHRRFEVYQIDEQELLPLEES